MTPAFSLSKLVDAIFNGAPAGEEVATYTMQVTSLISIYICFVALFLLGYFVIRLRKRVDLSEEHRSFWSWMAAALAFSISWMAGYIVYFSAFGT